MSAMSCVPVAQCAVTTLCSAREAAAHVERLPRALLLPLAEAERDAAGLTEVDLLTAPGIEPPTLRITRRRARPMVALARPL